MLTYRKSLGLVDQVDVDGQEDTASSSAGEDLEVDDEARRKRRKRGHMSYDAQKKKGM